MAAKEHQGPDTFGTIAWSARDIRNQSLIVLKLGVNCGASALAKVVRFILQHQDEGAPPPNSKVLKPEPKLKLKRAPEAPPKARAKQHLAAPQCAPEY